MVDSTNLPEVDINAIATDLNGKADRDLVNSTHPVVSAPYIVSRTSNSYNGITEIWSDGYCVVNGISAGTLEGSYFKIQLPVTFTTTNFVWCGQARLGGSDNGNYYIRQVISTVMKNHIYYFVYLNGSVTSNNPAIEFRAEGYIR